MPKKIAWPLVLSVALVIVGALGVWLIIPLVPGADIKSNCREPLTQGCMDSMRALGDELSASGNVADAASWYGWAAGGGDRIAMFKLGGLNYLRAIDDAIKETRPDLAGSDEGRRAAVVELAGFPAETVCGWFRRSADLGYPPAMNNVGECYLHGLGFKRSGLAAVQWHRSAAVAGNPVAAMNLMQDLKNGLGGKADAAAAETWANKRIDQANGSDLDDGTLAYTLRAGVQISFEEREMMRSDGATIASVRAAVEESGRDGGGIDCGFLAECAAIKGSSAVNAEAETTSHATQ
jgi:hypothetical protein